MKKPKRPRNIDRMNATLEIDPHGGGVMVHIWYSASMSDLHDIHARLGEAIAWREAIRG